MADIIQFRRDKEANWNSYNPVLAEGEVGFVSDDANKYKLGDGVKRWNELQYRGFNGTVASNKGNSVDSVMSQKAVTEELDKLTNYSFKESHDAYSNISLDVILKKGRTICNYGVPIILFDDAELNGRIDVATGQTVVLDSDKKYARTGVKAGDVDFTCNITVPYAEYQKDKEGFMDYVAKRVVAENKEAYSNVTYSEGFNGAKKGETICNYGVPIILFDDAELNGRIDVATGQTVVLDSDKKYARTGMIAGDVDFMHFVVPKHHIGRDSLSKELDDIIGEKQITKSIFIEKEAFSNIVLSDPIPKGYTLIDFGGFSGEILVFENTYFSEPVRRISSNTLPIEVDSEIKYIRASKDISHVIKAVKNGFGLNGKLESLEEKIMSRNIAPTYKGELLSGGVIKLSKNSVKGGDSFCFSADVSNFGSLRIGHGKPSSSAYSSAWLEVDGTSVNIFHYYTSVSKKTYSHGLNIGANIQILLSVSYSGEAKLTIASNGSVFVQDISWDGCNGDIFAESIGSTMTNVSFSWNCDRLKSDVWIFGDSYLSQKSEARWPYYLLQNGYDNVLLNAYPGERSSAAYSDLKDLLNFGSPKVLVWTLGMNDPDGDSVNNSWNATVDGLKLLCEEKGIELILATIPTVKGGKVDDTEISSIRIHKYKNSIVRNSGLRYIDFDIAVCANDSTGEWREGLLSSDGVHPTNNGAVTLFMKAMSDCPELLAAK